MKVCPACGAVYPDSMVYCGVDATPLQQEEAKDPLLGLLVDGRYRLQAPLGRGGFGAVYRALDERLRREVAVKVLYRTLAADIAQVDRFKREVCVLAALRHPNLVEVYDYGHDGAVGHFIVMEFLRGEGLAQRAARPPRPTLPEIYHVVRQVCGALAAAHAQGIIHRDVKLENVFLVDEPGAPGRAAVRLLDFGVAKVLSADQDVTVSAKTGRTTDGAVALGTPMSMSTEQLYGQAVDARTDVYALGVVLFELLAGRAPYTATTLDELVRQKQAAPPSLRAATGWAPPGLDRLLADMLSPDPSQRPADMPAVLGRLEEVKAAAEDAWAAHHLVPGGVTAPLPVSPPPAVDAPRVLVIDDDAGIRGLLRVLLEEAGWACTTAESAEAGLSLLHGERPPDAVVVDVMMPGMDGVSLLRRLREEGYAGPVAVCSSLSAAAVRAEVESMGRVRYVHKVRELHRVPEVLAALRGA